mgnify:CR=1 FL=1
MSQGIKCYAVTIRAFVICEDFQGDELPPNEWPYETLMDELSMTDSKSGTVSVQAELVHEFLCETPGEYKKTVRRVGAPTGMPGSGVTRLYLDADN